MAKIALIVGDRQGIKVALWIEEKLKNANHIVFFIDPMELNLPEKYDTKVNKLTSETAVPTAGH